MAGLFGDLLEIIKIQGEFKLDTKAACDDLLVDDFMLALGYNRKKNPSVTRGRHGCDWCIEEDGKVIGINTSTYKSKIPSKPLYAMVDVLIETNYDKCVITVVREDKSGEVKMEYTIGDDNDEMWHKLSHGTLDIYSLAPNLDIAQAMDIARQQLKEYVSEGLPGILRDKMGILTGFDTELHCVAENAAIEMFGAPDGTGETQQSLDADKLEIAELKTMVSTLEDTLDDTAEKLTQAKSEIAELTGSNGEAQEEISKLTNNLTDLSQRVIELEGAQKGLSANTSGTFEDSVSTDTPEFDNADEEQDDETAEEDEAAEEAEASGFDTTDDDSDDFDDTDDSASTGISTEAPTYNMPYEHSQTDSSGGVQSILDVVADEDTCPREYIGAINGELFRFCSLREFVSECISRLYKAVDFPLLQELYDGDMFQFKTPQRETDFILSGKRYELDFSNVTEEEAAHKLDKLFSKFSAVQFEYKFIGIKDAISSHDTTPENTDTIDYTSESDQTTDADRNETDEQDSDDNDDSFNSEDASDELEDTQSNEEELVDDGTVLLAIDAKDLGQLMWTDELTVKSIAYVVRDRVYEINKRDDTSMPFERSICKVVDAMLALCDDFYEAVGRLRRLELTSTSAYITKAKPNNKELARISFTQYCIMPILSLEKCVPIITELASCIFTGDTSVQLCLTAYPVDKDGELVQRFKVEREQYITGESDALGYPYDIQLEERVSAVISSGFTDSIILTKYSVQIMDELIASLIGIDLESGYIAIEADGSICEAMQEIVSKSNPNFDAKQLGNVLGTSTSILSDQDSGDGSITIGNTEYFIAPMSPWQALFALRRLQGLATKSKGDPISCEINQGVLDYYADVFSTTETSLGVSIKSVTDYLRNSIAN